MTQAAAYSVVGTLRDGRSVTIRALKPEDRSAMLSAVERVSAQSLYRRFFSSKRGFIEREVDFFINVDIVKHVALVASIKESGKESGKDTTIGGGRYSVTEPAAEVAFGRRQISGTGN